MSYLIAAYGVTLGSLVAYSAMLLRERRQLVREARERR
jgi:heme exporter protein D